jgi:hypothetical protein
MLQGEAVEIMKVSETLADTVKYIEMFKQSQGSKLCEVNPLDPKF